MVSAPAWAELGPVIYDQTSNPFSARGTTDFQAPNDHLDMRAADDFSVPEDEQWVVQQVFTLGSPFGSLGVLPATVNLTFYTDNAGVPGTAVADHPNLAPSAVQGEADFEIDLPTPLVLGPGTYWVSVQAIENESDQWLWVTQTAQTGNVFAWINPGDGFSTGCTDWAPITSCSDTSSRGLAFSLHGLIVNCPTDTSICIESAKSKLLIKKDKKIKWAWKGELSIGDIGDPSVAQELTHCIKVDGATVYGATISAGSGELKPEKKYRFNSKKDGPADGIKKARVKNGKPGKANGKIVIKTDGTNQPAQPIGGTTVESILASSTGACYKSTFTTAADVKKDDETTFKAKVKK